MTDQSHLDQRYFVDEHVYNCPFCNRRNVEYTISGGFAFDWSNSKRCFGFLVECHSCDKKSMHLTFKQVETEDANARRGTCRHRFTRAFGDNIDELFFFSVPTSFFVLDERIPRVLRELVTEAEGCLKSNFLTGGSACARKVIYELAVLENAEGENYEERVKSLKRKHSEVQPEFFDTLLTIQQVTSSKVHEGTYDGWKADHLRVILASLSEILTELYVVPATREDKRKAILELKNELLQSSGENKE